MTNRAGPILCVLIVALGLSAAAVAVQGAAAQTAKQSPLFKNSPQNRNQPVKIQAASLEVRDKDKRATFTGNVVVIQGDTEVRCNTLIVHYEGELAKGKSGAAPTATSGKGKSKDSNQQIRRMEARGNVVMIQKDQRATGERADFDVRANTVTVIGNVVVTSGESVLRGQQLFVDLTSGVSKMESGGGRVEALIPQKGKGPNAADNPGDGQRRPRRPK
jgi:lipopolysaccharide export system protein LptA